MEKSRKESEEVCERDSLSLISKVRILAALKFCGEWSHSPWCWMLWPVLLPFCFSSTSLSFAMCRPHACMKNWHWLLRNLVCFFFFRFSCVNKKGTPDLSWLRSSVWDVQAENKVCYSSLPRSSLDLILGGVFSHLFFFWPPPRNILAPKTFLAQIEGNVRSGRSLPSLWFKNFLFLTKLCLDHS